MNESSWEMTILDGIHPAVEPFVQFDDELPIISFFDGAGDWTVYTTNRMIGEIDGLRTEIRRSDFGRCNFRDFKQDLDSPRVTVATISCGKRKSQFYYESGYAAIAPIYYFRFWRIKWPVWKETYQIETRKQNQSAQTRATGGPV